MGTRTAATRIIVGLLCAAGTAGGAPALPRVPAPAAAPAPLEVDGLLQAESRLRLRSQIAGLVASIPHREGDGVEEGEAVVLLDEADSRLHVELATVDLEGATINLRKVKQGARDEERRRHKALYEEALAGLELAEKSLRSDQELHDKAMISDLELTKSERVVAGARAKVESAKLNLEIIEKGAIEEDRMLADLEVRRRKLLLAQRVNMLSHCRIEGGRPGRAHISRILVQVGQFLDPGTDVAEIVYMERVKVELDLPATEALALETGTAASITSETFPDVVLEGTVDSIAPVIDSASGTVHVVVLADNPGLAMRPGAEVHVEIRR